MNYSSRPGNSSSGVLDRAKNICLKCPADVFALSIEFKPASVVSGIKVRVLVKMSLRKKKLLKVTETSFLCVM